LIGVDHIILGVSYPWSSPNMQLLLQALRGYIEDGKVTVLSKVTATATATAAAATAVDQDDGHPSVLGMSLKNIHVENMIATMWLYMAKGGKHTVL